MTVRHSRRGRGAGGRVVVLLALVAGTAPAASGDQGVGVIGRSVAAVRVTVDGEPSSDPSLTQVIEVQAGTPTSLVRVRESLIRFMAMRRFEDVRVYADETGTGVTLTFDLRSIRRVQQLAFSGHLGLSEGELRSAVVEHFTATTTMGRAADIARMLEGVYRDRGYLSARVVAHGEPGGSASRAVLAFDVEAGPRVRAAKIDLQVPAGMDAADLANRLGLNEGMPFDPSIVRQKAANYVDRLRALRFFEATINPQFAFAPDGQRADVTVIVDRGPIVTLEFRGDPLPENRKAELVPVQREGSVDEDLLEDARRNIEDYLRSEGYRDAKADYRREPDGGRLKIVFDVRRGPVFRIGAIDLDGNSAFSATEIRAALRVQQGALYVRAILDGDVTALAERYRRRGFMSVRVTPTAEPLPSGPARDQAIVRLHLAIVEGARTSVGGIVFKGSDRVPADALRSALESAVEQAYYEPQIARDREAVLVAYLNRGYQNARVDTSVVLSSDRSRADVQFVIEEGPQIVVDHILVVGNTRTRLRTIEREVQLKPGLPLALNALNESQRRLVGLGLFRRVQVTALPLGTGNSRDVLVTVEEAPATTFGYGGGLEGSRRLVREGPDGGQTVEQFQFAPRGFFDIGRRNLWGKNRSINFFVRTSIRSKDPAPVSSEPGAAWVGGGIGFSDYRVLFNYREPRIFGEGSDLAVTGLAEQGFRSSFNFTREAARTEVTHRFSPTLSVSGRFSVENTRLFDERFNRQDKLLIDRLFPQVRLSIVSATLARDRRDDVLDPTRGTFVSVDGDLALRELASEVGFAKSYAQGFLYRRLPGAARVVFAGGVRLGLATGFPTTVPLVDEQGQPITGTDGRQLSAVVRSIPASERFYAGSDTTVRGYTLDRVGALDTIDSDGFPQGGMALVIFNAEMRFPVFRFKSAEVGGVAFVDVGNVFSRVTAIDLGQLRTGLGGGVRFRFQPLPLIRFDVGFNPGTPRQFENGTRERPWAVYLGIGHAF